MEKKFNYLYKITNNINNKFYYGIHSTNKLNDNYMGSGTLLHEAYNKYGIQNFTKEIICFKPSRKEISELEQKIVNSELVNNNNCYNICIGGGNLPIRTGFHHTDKFRTYLSKTHHKSDEQLKIKRRIMAKNGILKSVKINEINMYLKDGWSFDRRGAKYQHNMEEYNYMRKQSKEETNKIHLQKSKEYQVNKECKENNIKKLIEENIKNIDINKFGWLNQLNKYIPQYSKKEIKRILKLYFNDIIISANNKKTEYGKQIWVNNGVNTVRIKIDEYTEYINKGYKRGRK